MQFRSRLLALALAPLLIGAAQPESPPERHGKPPESVMLKRTKVECNIKPDMYYECQSDIPACYDRCEVGYGAMVAVCSAFPPPWSAICHAENSVNLGDCFRDCRLG
jgi:hypothetical protein